ncbi:hypothetical protein QAD02_018601 [Eretmocerus hayati]|uniref:Uncharacterized protein n=1 Tax=Eretmocerus hayati TaxID=131215 RepID=A0ACC2PGT2_9HYME|nr:hypothetical protein QAD02_018601 [Eretmocerus hayati]
MSSSSLRHWLSCGDVEKLENVVLEGKGIRLLGEQSSDLRTRVFLKGLPNYLTKIAQIHDAVARGSLIEVRKIVESEPKKKLVVAKDPAGTPLIHKAVYYDHQNILEWIINNYPVTVDQKDREGRTALHYCAACRDPDAVWDLLIESGCDSSECDRRAKPAAYYLHHSNEIELPDPERMAGRRLRPRNAPRTMTLDFKPSNIRIWIHNRDIGKLQHVLWEGHGSRLRCETSNNMRVKRFLDAVPFIMAAIKDIHTAVIKNDIEAFRQAVDEPVSPIILSSKDSNGLNVLHKAAGLGYGVMVKEILSRYPVIINAQDNEGRTPLHYAAICRDGGTMYDLLVVEGADETKVDNRHKMPSYYKHKASDVDLSCLVMIPDAPRVGAIFPRNWDWRIIDSDQPLRRQKRSKGHTSNNSNGDDDSAFDSGESTKLTEELATPEIENAEDELNGNENDENADAEKAEEDNEVGETENGDPEAEESEKPETAGSEEATAEADDNNNNDETESQEETAEAEAPQEEEAKNEEENENKTTNEEENNGEDEENAKENGEEENEENNEENAEEGKVEETEENNADDGEEKEADENAEENEAEGETKEEEEETTTPEEGTTDPDEGTKEESEENQPENDESKTDENEEQPDSGVGITPNDEEQEGRVPQAILGDSEDLLDGEPEQLDEETAELLASGTMEQLATIVLSGEGHRLVGRKSTDSDLQAFLNNVPNYMAKIQAVHKAAREGELKDLQTSLDRRKFAVAKDKSSPHGATPLHVAVIFGHTPVVRYLASRFPETAHALDFDGRTPLHYAATLNDNGHYYNLLLNLGANPLVQDNFGHKAAFYKENQEDLSHKQLLRDFGASEELADEMLEDKDEKIFEEEEGHYLAKSLGDPLIKGLTEVANTRPNNPVTYLATYLYNFANQDEVVRDSEGSDVLIIEEEKENTQEDPPKETKDEDESNNENDDGYPRSPTFEERQSHFAESERDENGQSPVHYAANRSQVKDSLYHMLQEKQMNIAIRDSQYRTARDMAEMAGNYQNVREIDRFVVYLAARGETDKLVELLMEGYDHILDTEDEGKNIIQIAADEGNKATVQFLQSISNYTESLDALHRAIRLGDLMQLRDLFDSRGDGAKLLAMGKNRFGRCTLHTAVLNEQVDIVQHIAKNYPDTLRVGDNLERTALHYATGIPSIEIMSNVLIQAGAKRVHKDLKLRQPAYYFMNRSEIRQLQEEEKEIRKMETGRVDDDSSD